MPTSSATTIFIFFILLAALASLAGWDKIGHVNEAPKTK
jgi:hypothetical protein